MAKAEMDALQVSVSFAKAFCAADLDRLATLIAPSFRLHGPLFRFESREDYLRALRADPPGPAPCRILQVIASGDEAAVLYEYGGSPDLLLIAQFNRLSRGLIAEVRLAFDTSRFPGGREPD